MASLATTIGWGRKSVKAPLVSFLKVCFTIQRPRLLLLPAVIRHTSGRARQSQAAAVVSVIIAFCIHFYHYLQA